MSVTARDKLLIDTLPTPAAVRDQLGDALREVELLRRLLRLADTAERYRSADRARLEHDKRVGNAGW
jgi:hypothetical protein